MSRNVIKNADRIGVFVITPAALEVKLEAETIQVLNARDLLSALTNIPSKGIKVLEVNTTSIMDMVYNVTRPLGIQLYKILDPRYIDEDRISIAIRNRIGIFDGLTMDQINRVHSLFASKIEAGDPPPVGDAFAILNETDLGTKEEDDDGHKYSSDNANNDDDLKDDDDDYV